MTWLCQVGFCYVEYNIGIKSTISIQLLVFCSQNTYKEVEMGVIPSMIVPNDFLQEFTSCL